MNEKKHHLAPLEKGKKSKEIELQKNYYEGNEHTTPSPLEIQEKNELNDKIQYEGKKPSSYREKRKRKNDKI